MRNAETWDRTFAGLAGIAVFAALLVPTLSLGASHNPKGEYARFAECPLDRKTITDCIYTVSSRGSFTLGKRTVPIKNAVVVQGGFEGSGSKVKFFGATNGNTLSETPQPVPGGLTGVTAPSSWPVWLQEWFNEGISKGMTNVTATLELAAPAGEIELNTENLISEEGTALGLPVKIKLENPLLGSSCHIGSDENPIQIDFTTGKSGAIKGTASKLSFNKSFTIITMSGGRLVNNSFAAPGASGCGGIFSYFFDPFVDSLLGTPSARGTNTAILEGKLQDAVATAVKASE